MTSCLVKPALYIVQKTGPRVRLAEPGTEEEEDTGQSESLIYYSSLLTGLQFLMSRTGEIV